MANVVNLKWIDTNPQIAKVAAAHKSTYVKYYGDPKDYDGFNYNVELQLPLQEDFQYTLSSEFDEASEIIGQVFGSFGNVFQKVQGINKLFAGASGNTTGLNDIFDLFKLKVWTATNPIEFTLNLAFHTKTNAWADVWLPTVSLASLCIISANYNKAGETTNYRTPGASMPNLAQIRASKKKANSTQEKNDKEAKKKAQAKKPDDALKTDGSNNDGFKNASKFLCINVPGIITLTDAFVEGGSVTWSKERTESGAPLWSNIQFTVKSTMPATDNVLIGAGANLALNTGAIGTARLLNQVKTLFT
jgi:hypothetical protein